MKVFITKRYYKRSRPSEEPIKYDAHQKRVGADVHATIHMDPVLRSHPDLRKALLKHETTEIRTWGKGESGGHSKARSQEPKIIRNIGGVGGFWKEIKRRKSKQ
jgi:hypothetical protein